VQTLQERYNPTSLLSREEKTRLTARRVGLNMPKTYEEEKVEDKDTKKDETKGI
jgi:hypothetical protein